MVRSPRRRFNRNRSLGIQNRVKGILKKANDLAQCYGIDVDMQIQLGDLAASYRSEPGHHTQRAIIPKDHVFGPEDFIRQNKKYDQLFSAQLPGPSTSALSPASCEPNFPPSPSVSHTTTIQGQSSYTPPRDTSPPSTSEGGEATASPREFISAMQASRRTSPLPAHAASISTQQARDLLDLVGKIF